MKAVLVGLDRISQESYRKELKDHRLGLLANQASLDGRLNEAKNVISGLFPGQLKALFGPQHGYGGEDQDNMVETGHSFDPASNLPIFSLYSETREPLPHMFEAIDTLIVDLQDVGTRVYTFSTTVLHCLRVAAKEGKKVIILDRPNPLGGETVEGNLLKPELYSFVGPYQIPMRHGLTMGELAQMFNHVFGLDCNLEVIPMVGWSRDMLWNETGSRWVMPSTNMPSPLTAAVYPGQVIWEGTNLSEGRGTCRPFEIFGAPYLNPEAIKKSLDPEMTKGCYLQEYSFRPTFNKWQGQLCHGFMIHILDPAIYRPYFTSVAILQKIMEIHEKDFKWKSPPYEYEFKKKPIDLILGDSSIRRELEKGVNVQRMRANWQEDIESFIKKRKTHLLYS